MASLGLVGRGYGVRVRIRVRVKGLGVKGLTLNPNPNPNPLTLNPNPNPGLAHSPLKRRVIQPCRKLDHRGVSPTYTEPQSDTAGGRGLAFTRYCFTSKLYCGSPSSFYCPPQPAKPTLPQHFCTPIARYTTPRPTPPLYAIHHTLLVMAIWCKGQGAARGRPNRQHV